MPSASRPRVLVALGEPAPGSDELWAAQPEISRVVRFRRASPSGLRFGRRLPGLGVDSLVVCVMALRRGRSQAFLASNPWIGVALRLFGCRDVAVTGVYAAAGSRSWRLLRRVLADSPVIANVEVEALAWAAGGGRAALVPYGKSFGYPCRDEHDDAVLRVFVGGSSDRDETLVRRLEAEVRKGERPARLEIATGGPASLWRDGGGRRITKHGYLTPKQFGALVAGADVVFLPLQGGQRAAGHSVAIGALEAGVPVASTPSRGMAGYVDGDVVSEIDPAQALLPALARVAERFRGRGDEVRAHWRAEFSPQRNVRGVLDALACLEAERASGA